MNVQFLLIGNDLSLRVLGLKDADTGDYIDDASVSAIVRDVAGNPVTGAEWPVTLSHVGGSNGDYRGVLQNTMNLREGHTYFVDVTADDGIGNIGFWKFKVPARYRS